MIKRTSNSVKPSLTIKPQKESWKKQPETLVPVPILTMDYETVLKDMKTKDELDENWLRKNKEVLSVILNTNRIDNDSQLYDIFAEAINRNRAFYTQKIENKKSEEYKDFVKSIWRDYIYVNPPKVPFNKEKSLLGLKALQEYGTKEDLRKLPREYRLSEDNDIMREYAKLVGIVGEAKDVIVITAKTDRKEIKLYKEDTIEEMVKTMKKIIVDKTEPKTWLNYDYSGYKDLLQLSNHQNKNIAENAQAIMRRLEEVNSWI